MVVIQSLEALGLRGLSRPAKCLTICMTRRIFISTMAMVILILSPFQQLSAQDARQIEGRAPVSKQSNQRLTAAQRTPEELRAQLNVLYDEVEATVRHVSDYAIGRDAFQKMGFDEGLSGVMSSLAISRKQLQGLSDNSLREVDKSIPNSTDLNNITVGLRKVRTDPDFLAALDRAEQWFNSENGRNTRIEAANTNSRSATSAPEFIKPVCHFDNLLNYPSAKDLSIAKAFAFAAEIVFLLIPAEVEIPIIGVEAPNPVRIAVAIAWGVLEAISLGLDQARSEGIYCQSLALNIQGALTNDAKFNMSVLLPRDAGGFADFLKEMVTAAIQNATTNNIPLQCANFRLNEANNLYNQGKWADAYKKYRAAYQNIGASSCL